MRKFFNKKTIVSTLVLSLLAYLGNYAAFPLFYSVAFIFGSISVIYAALSLGRVSSIIVAFVGSVYTIHLWGHPYAAIIFMLEALWVSSLIKKYSSHIVLIDLSYWLLIGVPLVFIFYTQFIGLPFNAAALISLKQSLNGVFNTLIASFIFIAINVFLYKKERVSIQPLLFNILLLITLVAGAIPSLMSANQSSINHELQLHEELKRHSKQIDNFIQIRLKQKDVTLKNIINTFPYSEDIAVVILDKNNKPFHQHKIIKSLNLEKNSEIITANNNITIWLPDKNLPSMKRWRLGRYIYRHTITSNTNISEIIVEKSAAVVVSKVNDLKIELFVILSLLMFFALAISFFLSRWITNPLHTLDIVSQKLNNNIISGEINSLPQSSISEFANFSKTLNKMASDISEDYQDLSDEKEHLVAIVGKNNEAFQRLSMVASRTTNSVVITDIDGKTEWVNEAFIKLTGYELNEMIGKAPGDILQGPETNGETIAKMSQQLKNKSSFSEDAVNYTKSGESYWVHIDCDPIIENNELLGFISIESDITQRKETEETLKNRTTKLNAVLNSATEISIISTNADGLISTFNSGAEKMLGYKASEIVDKMSPAVFHLESEVILRGHELSKQLHEKIEGFNTFIAIPNIEGSETREWTYIKKDGEHITVLLSVTPMSSSSATNFGYLGVAQDITERKRLDNMKKEFVSTVSHELRTPLTSINGTLSLLNGGAMGDIPEQAKQMLSVAIDNTQRLTLLINDLLDMDKIASGKMDFDLRSHEIKPLVEKSIQMNTAYAEQYNVTYQLESLCDDAKADIDPNRFLQVMANFLSNAAKFSHSDTAVDVAIKCENNKVIVSVKDYGVGIDESFFKHIFNKFSQADSSDTRVKGGTGLGLAITQELVKYMHGSIDFESNKGEGSVFWVELPLVE